MTIPKNSVILISILLKTRTQDYQDKMKIQSINQAKQIAKNTFDQDSRINGVTIETVFGDFFITKDLTVYTEEDAIKKGLK